MRFASVWTARRFACGTSFGACSISKRTNDGRQAPLALPRPTMTNPYQRLYDSRIGRWRARRRFARLWREQRRLEEELSRAVGTSEEEPLRDRIRAIDRQRELLAHDLGGGYPAAHDLGLMGPV